MTISGSDDAETRAVVSDQVATTDSQSTFGITRQPEERVDALVDIGPRELTVEDAEIVRLYLDTLPTDPALCHFGMNAAGLYVEAESSKLFVSWAPSKPKQHTEAVPRSFVEGVNPASFIAVVEDQLSDPGSGMMAVVRIIRVDSQTGLIEVDSGSGARSSVSGDWCDGDQWFATIRVPLESVRLALAEFEPGQSIHVGIFEQDDRMSLLIMSPAYTFAIYGAL